MGSVLSAIAKLFDPNERELRRLRGELEEVNSFAGEMRELDDDEFPDRMEEYRRRHADGETLDELMPECFALVRGAADRTLGERPFDVQVIGAMVLHEGKIAEMKTGEGKTLTATMPLVLNSLSGKGAHLVTTNDFLVRWQAEWMGQIYRFLGLTVGNIQHDMDSQQRINEYNKDITYVENSELGFDYLRDNMAGDPEQLCLPELHYAIIDEVDSILIDEARTPLIISGTPQQSPQFYEGIDRIVRRLEPSTNQDVEDEEPNGDYIVEEKFHQAALTEEGQRKVENALNIDNLSDPEYLDIAHHAEASVKAHSLYDRDEQYIVKDDQVVIVDEFTGHAQPGRRFSDGLHQAIEAKEGVQVQQARQTVASITYQNFFREYDKLAGMTGTAKTEEKEFVRIYDMPVVVVPTNEPVIRKDHPDMVFKTAEAKHRAIVCDILSCYFRQQPTLVGTRSVEANEYISGRLATDKLRKQMIAEICTFRIRNDDSVQLANETREEYLETLRTKVAEINRSDLRPICRDVDVAMNPTDDDNLARYLQMMGLAGEETSEDELDEYLQRLTQVMDKGIPHNVLNAKNHEREGEIIAQAGRPGGVTVATNMAGRGVDIVLGGQPEDEDEKVNPELQEKVKEKGGLHVIGTERHEARRIDNQLRGRSGRQGDPGSSRFYVSLEDELMKLFGPDRFGFFLKSWPEEEAIEHGTVSKSIERAQHKVEERNFGIRKHTLQYDDVMNTQRKIIYGDRRRVLMDEDISDSVLQMVDRTVDSVVDTYASMELHPEDRDLDSLYSALTEAVPGLESYLSMDDLWELNGPDLGEQLRRVAREHYQQREQEIGAELMREIERSWLLRIIDDRWMQHLQEMDNLRESIGLRAHAQKDPLVEYQKEAHDYFETLLDHIAQDMTKAVLSTEVAVEWEGVEVDNMQTKQETPMTEAAEEQREGQKQPVVKDDEPGRNDPCPCGSGKKYKYCCLLKKKEKETEHA